jgi:hypothetical protein
MGYFGKRKTAKHTPLIFLCSIGYWNALVWLDRFNAGSSLRLMELHVHLPPPRQPAAAMLTWIFLIELMVEKFQRSVLALVL